jgi:RimJ/RimL family protein N-acetyltransferase
MHWRVRALLRDEPGALASVAGCCGEEGLNILELQVFPSEQGVVDDLIVHSPDGWTATDVEDLLRRAGARDPQALPCTPHELEDTATRYLRAAQTVLAHPRALPQELARLLGASTDPTSADTDELLLDDGHAPPVHLFRRVPFTATEHARAYTLRQLATASAPRPTPVPGGSPAGSTSLLRVGSPEDAGMLVAMHARCSAETIQRRYHAPMPYLSPRLAHALLRPQHGRSVVMTCGDDLVGIASFARDHDGEYELGLLVEDRRQRQGFGSRLLHAVTRQAAHQGIATLTCYIQPDNQAILATIRRAGLTPRISRVDGLLRARVSTTATRSGARANRLPMGEVTNGLVPLLHARDELRQIYPLASLIDHAVRGGA